MGFTSTYLQPALKPWLNSSLEKYLNAIGVMFDPLSTVVDDSEVDPGWGSILNPVTFPTKYNPAYLGQYVGVEVPVGFNPPEALILIAQEQGFARGTSNSIRLAAQRALKEGAVTPIIFERENIKREVAPYAFILAVKSTDVTGAISTKGDVTSGSEKIKNLVTTTGLEVGAMVFAKGLEATPTVTAINSSTEVTVSEKATATNVGTTVVFVNQSNLATLKNNVNSVKPAGLLWTLWLIESGTYGEAEIAHTLYSESEAKHATYEHAELHAGA